MNLRRARREDPEINLISLIDVVLILVIFFMLSSTFSSENRLHIRLPQAANTPSSAPPPETLVISLTQQGTYELNGRELINASPETLRAALIKETGAERKRRVILRADGRATHQSVITAMDVLGRMGFQEIGIATVKDTGSSAP